MSREKSYIMTHLDGNNHSVFSLNYHLILITKYRKEVITDIISEYLKHIFCYIAPKYKIRIQGCFIEAGEEGFPGNKE